MWSAESALLIGLLGGIVFMLSSKLKLVLMIDCPLQATSVHFFWRI
jgi:ammonia channel protein AmtB